MPIWFILNVTEKIKNECNFEVSFQNVPNDVEISIFFVVNNCE
jgi:hypothetical protein